LTLQRCVLLVILSLWTLMSSCAQQMNKRLEYLEIGVESNPSDVGGMLRSTLRSVTNRKRSRTESTISTGNHYPIKQIRPSGGLDSEHKILTHNADLICSAHVRVRIAASSWPFCHPPTKQNCFEEDHPQDGCFEWNRSID
jgi:hypothetical protein